MAGKLSLLRGAETEPPSQSLLVEQEKIQKEFQYDADVKQLICDMDSAIESIGIRKRSARAAEQAADPEPDISMDDATDAMRDVYNSMARSSAASGAEKLQALHTVMRVLSRAVSHGSWREDMEADDDVTYQKMEPIISFSAKIHKVHSNIRASKGGHVRHNATWAPEEDESLILALRNHGMDAVIPARTEDSVIHRRFKIFMNAPYSGDPAKIMAAFPKFTEEDVTDCLQHTHRKRKRAQPKPAAPAPASEDDEDDEDEVDDGEDEEEEDEEEEEEEEEDEDEEEEEDE